eukprot:NODE_6387_length_851_cov_95.063187_g6151_i0.p1 GENE.NODE_6387_length_851_cov_95.063187_g6151_i0~~NODE_6387_length_851_cov_95.063187_g6151_i0.p1  ORF type:complete len:164 (-),score=39.60 NODE_6387_length_851_cov_95.063187_g6151_i0:283-774(-)
MGVCASHDGELWADIFCADETDFHTGHLSDEQLKRVWKSYSCCGRLSEEQLRNLLEDMRSGLQLAIQRKSTSGDSIHGGAGGEGVFDRIKAKGTDQAHVKVMKLALSSVEEKLADADGWAIQAHGQLDRDLDTKVSEHDFMETFNTVVQENLFADAADVCKVM